MSKKIYFASDLHLGVPDFERSLAREKHFISWLEFVRTDAEEIHLVGDVFDFWFEYKRAVPRGFTRLLGKLAELTDSGIVIYMYLGNHDMWMFDYLPQEIGIILTDSPIERTFGDKRFYIAHGDGLGPGDHGYKFLKKVFRNRMCQWLFARLHPNFGIGLADYFSRRSRMNEGEDQMAFLGEENEWLIIHSKELVARGELFDYYVYGHRHLPMEIDLGDGRVCMNLGDWISHFTYAVFDGEKLSLDKFPL